MPLYTGSSTTSASFNPVGAACSERKDAASFQIQAGRNRDDLAKRSALPQSWQTVTVDGALTCPCGQFRAAQVNIKLPLLRSGSAARLNSRCSSHPEPESNFHP